MSCCKKPIDGLTNLGNIVADSLTLSGGQQGQILTAVNNVSNLQFSAKYSDRVIEAFPGDGAFSEAVNKATALSPTLSNPVTIHLYPGTYEESSITTTITPPSNCNIISMSSGSTSSLIELTNASFPVATPFICIQDNVNGADLIFAGNRNCDTVIEFDTSNNQTLATLFRCSVYGGKEAGVIVRQNSLVFIVQFQIVSNFLNGKDNTIDTVCFDVETGCNVFYNLANVSHFGAPNNLIGYRVSGTSVFEGVVATINFMKTGIILNDTAKFLLFNTLIIGTGLSDTGAIINDDAELDLVGCDISGYNEQVRMVGSNCKFISTGSRLETDRLNLNGGILDLQYFDPDPNNLGNHVLGNQIVGRKNGTTTNLYGEGSISLQNLAVLKEDFGGSIFTDVSTTIKPAADTSVVLFDNLTANEAFYVGDDNKFSGFTYTVSIAQVANTSDIVYEYWNGSAWTEFTVMVNDRDPPYESYALDFASVVQDQVIRFDNDILLSTTWQQNSVNSITKYWMRLKIVNPITTSASIKNLKLTGNQFKINSDGTIEYFGTARPRKILPFDWNLVDTLPGGNIANQNVFFSPTIGIGRNNNSYTNGDGASFVSYLQAEQDTSSSVNLIITFVTDGTSTNVFEMSTTYACTSDGEIVALTSGSAVTPSRIQTKTFQLTPNIIAGTSRQQTTEIKLNSGACSSRTPAGKVSDLISLLLERVADTNPDRLVIINVSLSYLTAYNGFTDI